MQPIQTIDGNLVDELIARAKASPRLRTNHNFHETMEENPHRFLNVMCRGTYFTPHRHSKPAKHESFLVLKGEVGFLEFSETGEVTKTYLMKPEGLLGKDGSVMGVDIQPGVWHCLVVLSDVAVCYEVKPGPYRVTDDKEFADWAPHEGSEGTVAYAEQLLKHFED